MDTLRAVVRCLCVLLLVPNTAGVRPYVRVKSSDGTIHEPTCLGAGFSVLQGPPIATFRDMRKVTIDCSQAEVDTTAHPTLSGVVVIIDMKNCKINTAGFWTQVDGLEPAGVLLIAEGRSQIPTPLASSLPRLEFPVCMMWREEGLEIMSKIPDSWTSTTEQVDFSSFISWDRANLEYNPKHSTTPIDVLDPFDFKWRYVAGQATFNPENTQAHVGSLVFPEFKKECAFSKADIREQMYFGTLALPELCEPCYDLPDRQYLDNDVTDHVLLFDPDHSSFSVCFLHFTQLSFIAQQAGVAGAIVAVPGWRDLLLGPYTIPFNVTVPMLSMVRFYVAEFSRNIGKDIDIVVRIPAITDGTGPHYDVTEPPIKDIEETKFRVVNNNDDTLLTMVAGQATFNPKKFRSNTLPGIEVKFDETCRYDNTTRNCDKCYFKLQARTALETRGVDINGKLAVIDANEFYCAHTWAEAASALQDVGAGGAIVINVNALTWTLVDKDSGIAHSDDADEHIDIPMLNIRSTDGEKVLELMSRPGTLIEMPEFKDGLAVTNLTHNSSHHQLPPVQIYVTANDDSLDGYRIAGQSLYNPNNTQEILGDVAHPTMADVCSSTDSCHGCEQLGQPMYGSNLKDKIFLIRAAQARCVRPLANYAMWAQKLGAKGVLLVNDDDRIYTEGPQFVGFDLTIPVFNIENSLGTSLIDKLKNIGWRTTAPRIQVLLPQIVFKVPVEKVGRSTVVEQDEVLEEEEIIQDIDPELIESIGQPVLPKPQLEVTIQTSLPFPERLEEEQMRNLTMMFCDKCRSFYEIKMTNIQCSISEKTARRLKARVLEADNEKVIDSKNETTQDISFENTGSYYYSLKAAVLVNDEEAKDALDKRVADTQKVFLQILVESTPFMKANNPDDPDVSSWVPVNITEIEVDTNEVKEKIVERTREKKVTVEKTIKEREGLSAGQVTGIVISAVFMGCCLCYCVARWFRNRRKLTHYDKREHSMSIDCQTDFEFDDMNLIDADAMASSDDFPSIRSGLFEVEEEGAEGKPLAGEEWQRPPSRDNRPMSPETGMRVGPGKGNSMGKIIYPSNGTKPLSIWESTETNNNTNEHEGEGDVKAV